MTPLYLNKLNNGLVKSNYSFFLLLLVLEYGASNVILCGGSVITPHFGCTKSKGVFLVQNLIFVSASASGLTLVSLWQSWQNKS